MKVDFARPQQLLDAAATGFILEGTFSDPRAKDAAAELLTHYDRPAIITVLSKPYRDSKRKIRGLVLPVSETDAAGFEKITPSLIMAHMLHGTRIGSYKNLAFVPALFLEKQGLIPALTEIHEEKKSRGQKSFEIIGSCGRYFSRFLDNDLGDWSVYINRENIEKDRQGKIDPDGKSKRRGRNIDKNIGKYLKDVPAPYLAPGAPEEFVCRNLRHVNLNMPTLVAALDKAARTREWQEMKFPNEGTSLFITFNRHVIDSVLAFQHRRRGVGDKVSPAVFAMADKDADLAAVFVKHAQATALITNDREAMITVQEADDLKQKADETHRQAYAALTARFAD